MHMNFAIAPSDPTPIYRQIVEQVRRQIGATLPDFASAAALLPQTDLILTAIGGWVNQWILRKGGTDTQWLWFSADPPGLKRDNKPKQP